MQTCSLIYLIVQNRQLPQAWSTSVAVPIWKEKGNIADCLTYRPTLLTSHTLMIVEWRLRKIVIITLSTNTCSPSTPTGRYREKRNTAHVAFFDLEKAFGRIPHDVKWWAFRTHCNPGEHIDWIKLVHPKFKSYGRCSAAVTNEFRSRWECIKAQFSPCCFSPQWWML